MGRVLRLLPALAAVWAAGCGKAETPPLHPVTGQVIYDGKPAAGVQVVMWPTNVVLPEGTQGYPVATTGPDGRFTVSTQPFGEGAPEGSYRVVLYWPPELQEGEEAGKDADRFFGWHDSKHTKLTADVKTGRNEFPPFKLPAVSGPPPASEGIPGRN